MMTADEIAYVQCRIARYDDQQAYKDLFTALYPFLFAFARTLVRDKETAEEVVSDVFIRIWEKRKELERIRSLKVYLYVCTRHTAYNYINRQIQQATDPLDDIPTALTSVYLDPEQLMITADMIALIQRAIDQLPPRCRMVFKLVKEDGLKVREVAEVLALSPKTVENHLAIAIQKIGKAVRFDIHAAMPSLGH